MGFTLEKVKIKHNGVTEIVYFCPVCKSPLLRFYTDNYGIPQVFPFSCQHYDWGYATKEEEIPEDVETWKKGALLYFYIRKR